MKDKKFTDGLIVKRTKNASEFVIANLTNNYFLNILKTLDFEKKYTYRVS
jgi:hypothetical protein